MTYHHPHEPCLKLENRRRRPPDIRGCREQASNEWPSAAYFEVQGQCGPHTPHARLFPLLRRLTRNKHKNQLALLAIFLGTSFPANRRGGWLMALRAISSPIPPFRLRPLHVALALVCSVYVFSLPHPSPPQSLSLLNSERVYWGVTSDPRAI